MKQTHIKYSPQDTCCFVFFSLTLILGADRCLRFDYGIADNNLTSPSNTALIDRVHDDVRYRYEVYRQHTGNNWTTAELDLPDVLDMKVRWCDSHDTSVSFSQLILTTRSKKGTDWQIHAIKSPVSYLSVDRNSSSGH